MNDYFLVHSRQGAQWCFSLGAQQLRFEAVQRHNAGTIYELVPIVKRLAL